MRFQHHSKQASIFLLVFGIITLFGLKLSAQDNPIYILPISKYEFLATSKYPNPISIKFEGKPHYIGTAVRVTNPWAETFNLLMGDQGAARFPSRKIVSKFVKINAERGSYKLSDNYTIKVTKNDLRKAIQDWADKWGNDGIEELLASFLKPPKDLKDILYKFYEGVQLKELLQIVDTYGTFTQLNDRKFKIMDSIDPKAKRFHRSILPSGILQYRLIGNTRSQVWGYNVVEGGTNFKASLGVSPEILLSQKKLITSKVYLTGKLAPRSLTFSRESGHAYIPNEYIEGATVQDFTRLDRADSIKLENKVLEFGISPTIGFGTGTIVYAEFGVQYQLSDMDLNFYNDASYYFNGDSQKLTDTRFEEVGVYSEDKLASYFEFGFIWTIAGKKITYRKRQARRGLTINVYFKRLKTPDITFKEQIIVDEVGQPYKALNTGEIQWNLGFGLGFSF